MMFSPIVRKILIDLAKNRVYITHGKKAPEGRKVIHTKNGKQYYVPLKRSSSKSSSKIEPFDVMDPDWGHNTYLLEGKDSEYLRSFLDELIPQYDKIDSELKVWREKYKEWDPTDTKDFLGWEHKHEIQDRVRASDRIDPNIRVCIEILNRRMLQDYFKENPNSISTSGEDVFIENAKNPIYEECDKDHDEESLKYIEDRKNKSDLFDKAALENLVIDRYVGDVTFKRLSNDTMQEYLQSYKTLDKGKIRALCNIVNSQKKLVMDVISEFQKTCDKLDIPNIRSQSFYREKNFFEDIFSTVNASVGEGILYLNPSLITTDPYEFKNNHKDSLKKPFVSSKFANNVGDELRFVLWHELGHQIVRYYGGKDPEDKNRVRRSNLEAVRDDDPFILNTLFDGATQAGEPRLYNAPNFVNEGSYDEERGPTLLKSMSVSDYASTNPNECFAEAFACHKMGKDNLLHQKFKYLFERLGI